MITNLRLAPASASAAIAGSVLVCLLSSHVSGPLGAAEPASRDAVFRWVEEPGRYFELRCGDRPVVRYMCEAYDDSTPRRRDETYKPYHHVFSPDGSQRLTKGGPDGLFPHHRGLFYGFNVVTHGDGQRADVWHCRDGAYQSHLGVECQHADSESAGHVVTIGWHGRDGEMFAREQRGINVRKQPGGLQIDFTSRLRSVDGQSIRLDGDPQHAGFHFRAAQEVADTTTTETYFLRTDGRGAPRETRNWDPNRSDSPMSVESENRPWNAMSFVVGGQRYTVLYIDHPENPKPARYSERDYGRFGSYFVADVTADKPVDVKYRIWVQEGEMTVEQCAAMHREFVKAGSVSVR